MPRPIDIPARAERAIASMNVPQALELRDRVTEAVERLVLDRFSAAESNFAAERSRNAELTRDKAALELRLMETAADLDAQLKARARLEAEIAELLARIEATHYPVGAEAAMSGGRQSSEAPDPDASGDADNEAAGPIPDVCVDGSSDGHAADAEQSVCDPEQSPTDDETGCEDPAPAQAETGSTVLDDGEGPASLSADTTAGESASEHCRRGDHRKFVVDRLAQRDELFLSVRAENEVLEKEGAQLAEQLNEMNLALAATRETCLALEEEKVGLMRKLESAGLAEVA